MHKKTFINSFKLFLKTVSCILPYVILLVLINYLLSTNYKDVIYKSLIDNNSIIEPMLYFGNIRKVCYLLFSFYLFIAYEFFRKSREASLNETLSSLGFRGSRIVISQITILMLCVIISSLNIVAYSFIGYKNISCPKIFISNIIIMNILDILLLSITAICIGYLISKIEKRFIGYSILAIILIFVSPVVNRLLINLDYKNISLYKLRDLINFIPPDINAIDDTIYGFPLEKYRFEVVFLWIFIFFIVFSYNWLRNKEKVKKIVCCFLFIGVIINGYLYLNKGSVLLASDHPESAIHFVPKFYFEKNVGKEKADFKIKSYDADFKINKKLKACVKMEIETPTQKDKYKFTLYHNYKIKKVYDENGNKLKFNQHNDYFDVEKPNNRDIKSINVEYSGFSETFYSNGNATFLPGFFAYYPQPGYNIVFSKYDFKYIQSQTEKSQFNVHIESKLKMFSNLDGANNEFSGKAENLTLIGGFVEETQINNQQVIMLPMDVYLSKNINEKLSIDFENKIKKIEDVLGQTDNINLSEKKIVNFSNSLAFNSLLYPAYIFDDYILLSTVNTNEYNIFDSCIPYTENKRNLKKFFLNIVYLKNENREIAMFEGNQNRDSDIHNILVTKINEYGLDYVAPIVYEYLKDESNTQDELEFLNSIKK